MEDALKSLRPPPSDEMVFPDIVILVPAVNEPCFVERVARTLVAKFAELSSAPANSFKVSNAAGAPLIKSTPFIRIEVASTTLKLASLAEISP